MLESSEEQLFYDSSAIRAKTPIAKDDLKARTLEGPRFFRRMKSRAD
jgi:hypothetical protein